MNSQNGVLKWAWIVLAALAWIAFGLAASRRSEVPSVWDRWSPGYALFVGAFLAMAIGCSCCLSTRFRAALWAKRGPLLALGFGGLLALAGGEIALRYADPLGISYLDEMQRYIGMRESHDELVYVQPKDQSIEIGGTTVQFNNMGLRGPDLGPKQQDTKRVLFLGDSVVFGWGVDEERTFVRRLASKLGERTGEKWESINAGVCSYNTEQEDLYLELSGLALEPDLIVLVLIDNDVLTYSDQWKRKAAEEQRSPIRRLQNILRRTHLYRFAQHYLKHGKDGISTEGGEQGVQPGDLGWEANMDALTRLIGRCEAAQIPLSVFHFRWASNAWSDEYLSSARSAAGATPITDTAAWFTDKPLRAWVNSATDSHPNAGAHEWTAIQMLETLTGQGAIKGL